MKKHSKIISLIVAFLLALVLWAYTVTYISPEKTQTYRDIPVNFTAKNVLEANGLILTGGMDQTVSLTIRGNRTDLAKLNSENIKITASLGSITESGVNEVSYTISYPDTVAGGDLAVEGKYPGKLKIQTGLANTKTLSVSVKTEGTLPEGYLLENAEAEVDSVSVFGPAEEINQISKAEVSVDISDMKISEKVVREFRFYNEAGEELTLSPLCTVEVKRFAEDNTEGREIFVRLDILYFRDLELKAVCQNLPEDYEIVSTKVIPQTVRVTGNKSDLDKLDAQLQITVDLSAAERSGNIWTATCPIDPPKEGINLHDEQTTATVTVVAKQVIPEPEETTEDVE